MYIIVRSGFPPGKITAQACHIAIAAAHKWNVPADNTLVVLESGESEDSIWDLISMLDIQWDPIGTLTEDDYVYFLEPDLDNEVTGFAIRPGLAPKWLSKRPLLFSGLGVKTND